MFIVISKGLQNIIGRSPYNTKRAALLRALGKTEGDTLVIHGVGRAVDEMSTPEIEAHFCSDSRSDEYFIVDCQKYQIIH